MARIRRNHGNREESAMEKKLSEVRSEGHPYVQIRRGNEKEKKLSFFCVLCLRLCISGKVLDEHLRGKSHTKKHEAAKMTLLKANPWPFDDGLIFFHKSPQLLENLSIPQVLIQGTLSVLNASPIGVGEVSIRYVQKNGVTQGVRKIWCQWMGNCNLNKEIIPLNEFGVVVFNFDYDLGGMSDHANTTLLIEENEGRTKADKNKKKKLERKKLMESFRSCNICNQKMVKGKDVGALVNLQTKTFICSNRKKLGAFHVYHISCLISWILLSQSELYEHHFVKNLKRKRGVENEKKAICTPFCLECKGSDGLVSVTDQEVCQYVKRATHGLKEYMSSPEILPNVSTGLYFPAQKPETLLQEMVSPLFMIGFYRAV